MTVKKTERGEMNEEEGKGGQKRKVRGKKRLKGKRKKGKKGEKYKNENKEMK